jgi:2,4-dienoyl-CoA reductase-like NADH-dependent reductase (Old Yellow Enzyme family)
VIQEGTRTLLFDEPRYADGLRPMVEAVHDAGARVAIQLFVADTVGEEQVDVSARDGAREVTATEIETMHDCLARAAAACQSVGFDAVEPHGAHGFFMNRFFSPVHNRRTDAYGGSLENRMRFGLAAVRAVRSAVGAGYPIFYRHTPREGGDGGYTIDDSRQFCRALVDAGVDVLDVSPSNSGEGPHADMAAAIKQAVAVPVIAVGGMNDPRQADAALAEEKCDLVAIGRGLIADAHWPAKVSSGHEAEVIECVECNEKCFGNLRRGLPVACAQNPESGSEYLRAR